MGGLDYGLLDNKGSFNPDVVSLLQTEDDPPCDILVQEKGRAPNVFLLFETSCYEKYAWLNTAVAYGKATQTDSGIILDVFKVSVGVDSKALSR